MIASEFVLVPPGTPLASSLEFGYTSDSPVKTMEFDAGSDQPIVLKISGAGEQFAAHAQGPRRAHQRVGVRIRQGSVLPGEAYAGVFCRYVDRDNCVIGRADLNTGNFEIIERVNGTQTTLSTTDTASFPVGAGLVVEVVGARVRWWTWRGKSIPEDRPPDGAADLSGPWSDTTGYDWGLYYRMTGSSDVEIERFEANELADQYLPPAGFLMNEATNYALAPVTISVANLVAGTLEWELDVSAQDSDDYVEALSLRVEPSVSSVVLQLRPGFTYLVRTREVLNDGTKADWVQQSVTVDGSKYAPPATSPLAWSYPNVIPEFVLDRQQVAAVNAAVSESGQERVVATQERPRSQWTLKYTYRSQSDANKVLAFFDLMRGQAGAFNWTHPSTGQVFQVRFATDDLRKLINDVGPGSDGSGADGNLVDFDVPIIEAVDVGAVALPDSFTLNPVLTSGGGGGSSGGGGGGGGTCSACTTLGQTASASYNCTYTTTYDDGSGGTTTTSTTYQMGEITGLTYDGGATCSWSKTIDPSSNPTGSFGTMTITDSSGTTAYAITGVSVQLSGPDAASREFSVYTFIRPLDRQGSGYFMGLVIHLVAPQPCAGGTGTPSVTYGVGGAGDTLQPASGTVTVAIT